MVPRVMIAVPTLGNILTGTVQCLLALIRTTRADCQLMTTEGISFIPAARNYLASVFLASNCDYLLAIDADLVFPCGDATLLAHALTVPLTALPDQLQAQLAFNSLDLLLSHDKAVVGADYLRKSQIHRDRNQANTVNAFAVPLEVQTGWDFHLRRELLLCTYVAAGFVLIHRSVFEQLQQAYPALRYREGDQVRWGFYNPLLLGEQYLPEDYAFCHRLQEQRIELWLEPRLVLGHVGNYTYNAVSTTLQRLAKVQRRPDLCLVTPDWLNPETWSEHFIELLTHHPPVIQSIVLWCDPTLAATAEAVLGDLLLSCELMDNEVELWIDNRSNWELPRLFAEASFWHASASIPHYQSLARQQQVQVLP